MHLPGAASSGPLTGITRPASSSPAVGTHARHELEQHALVEQAFAPPELGVTSPIAASRSFSAVGMSSLPTAR